MTSNAVNAAADPWEIVADLRRQLAATSAERDEAIAQRTATAEVLQVINSSPGDLAAVFEAILDRAHALCGAARGTLFLFDGEVFRAAAVNGYPPELAERLRQGISISQTAVFAPLLAGARLMHNPDLAQVDDPFARAVAQRGGVRTNLLLPLRKDGLLLGMISCNRLEVRPFTDKEIALIEDFAVQAVIAIENARLLTETREALERQTATAEILRVISSSPTDVQPTFDAIARAATTLTGAANGIVLRFDGSLIHFVAHHGLTSAQLDAAHGVYPLPPGRGSVTARAILTREVAHVADMAADPEFAHPSVIQAGLRTMLAVPMLRDGNPIGAITVARNEIAPFSDKQIDLLQTFADQAVIAIENVRLFNELNDRTGDLEEALEYQTATGDVLKVISQSTFDIQPVFETIVATAARLCDSDQSMITNREGDAFRVVATFPALPELDAALRGRLLPMSRGSMAGRAAAEGRIVHVADIASDPEYTLSETITLGQLRTALTVPLLRDGNVVGTIGLGRQRVQPFTERQIELVRTFADQAVIAIENARLINETREALEQQTATAEVLQVINASPGDLAPVFDAMLANATRLCEAETGHLLRYEGGRFLRVASLGVPEDFDKILPLNTALPHIVTRDSIPFRMLAARAAVHVHDAREDESVRRGAPAEVAAVAAGIRTALFVPLLKEGEVVGCFVMHRLEVRPFADKQIALLENFAAQAVIAIENARLLTETREALERQTATAEILRVISSSPTDVQPTFDAIASAAKTLCGATLGAVFTFDGTLIQLAAADGWTKDEMEMIRSVFPIPPGRGSVTARAILMRAVAHIEDMSTDPEFAYPTLAQTGGHTALSVPMLRDGNPIGAITVQRRHVEPFTDKQIDLLKTFADQAVIAIENVRLFNELNERTDDLQESLEYQTATSDVLKVISRSTFDLQRVLETLAESAAALAQSDTVFIFRREGEIVRLAAMHAPTPAFGATIGSLTIGPDRKSTTGRALLTGEVVCIDDVLAEPGYQLQESETDQLRSTMAAPLLREGETIGVITLARLRVEPFTQRQIELVRTFADQAVIAIENTRLITETREALEQQTATAEILQVINSSPGDLAPVFDAILEKATQLCGVTIGSLEIWDGVRVRALATCGVSDAFDEVIRQGFEPGPNDPIWQLLEGARFVHILDQAVVDEPTHQKAVDLDGIRTFLCVALRKDSTLLGRIVAARAEVRPFAEKEIALLENFAAQAVIAMENARLLDELRERTGDLEESLEYQTATSEVLQVISRSTFDLDTILETVATSAYRLCRADYAVIFRNEGGEYRWAAGHGISAEYAEHERRSVIRPGTGTVIGRAVLDARAVHIEDAWADPLYEDKAAVQAEGNIARTMLGVPLLREGVPIGAIGLARNRVEPFSERETQLVTTFADQAVIAIENARLITETREALEQQTATAEVLQVINSSPGDLAPVFDAMLDKATRLCDAHSGFLWTYDGERYRAAATRGLPPSFDEFLREPRIPGPQTGIGRLARGEKLVHFADLATIEPYAAGDALHRASVDLGGFRTILVVPLRKDDTLLGGFTIDRQEVRSFTDKQIALLQNFAAQAVIAIENARLLGELRERTGDLEESLEYQTATSDVLKVISRSTFDLQPVLDTLVETAARLCAADGAGVTIREGEVFRYAAIYAIEDEFWQLLRQRTFAPGRGTMVGRTALEGNVVHVADISADAEYTLTETVTIARVRTALGVPMLRDGAVVGTLTLTRDRVEPFTERQIELVRTFADQAVIAIENARLLTETREALEQQTATAEILQVINSSPGDLAPVFDTMLEKAMRLCEATFGVLHTYDGKGLQLVAQYGLPPRFAEFASNPSNQPGPGGATPRLIGGARIVHIVDLKDEEAYRSGDPYRRALVDIGGARSFLAVPLRQDAKFLGQIAVYRQEVRPYTDKQIALLESFAAQAVIAMENARLLNEIRQRQAELRVTFDNMGDGVAMFDADMRLAAWNMNFQKILDLPDEFVAQRPTLPEYFQYMAARGEYDSAELEAELRRDVAIADHESRFERTRPDGQVIEVRRNAVPGGGSVLIFSDVTERKRAEAEIRTARDAAEGALRELKVAQAGLIQAEKMASLGQLTAGIAHEIKNPLNFVNNFASLSVELLDELKESAAPALASLDADARAEIEETVEMLTGNLEKIGEHGRRADGIVKSMLEHSRGASGERRSVDLNALVEEALNLAYHGARAQDQNFNITLEREFAAAIAPIEVVPQDVTRVFLNLFGNGFYAANKRRQAEEDAGFKPILKVTTRELGDMVEVAVRDNGTGIAPEVRDKLFQPFFTTKPTGEGTGLGLSISYDIVTQQHGGTIAVDSEVGNFTEFTIRLPRNEPNLASPRAGEV